MIDTNHTYRVTMDGITVYETDDKAAADYRHKTLTILSCDRRTEYRVVEGCDPDRRR